MRSSEDIIQKMNAIFQELGMEEEINKLMEKFTDNFAIYGDITENLGEALQRAPDGLLDMIWDNVANEEPAEEIDRVRKEEILYREIQKDMEANLICMEPDKLALLIKVMCGSPIDIMYMTTVNEEFVPRGWAFNFAENGNYTIVVMDEIRQILKKLDEQETKEELAFAFYVRSVINVCLGLYGIVRWEQFKKMYQEIMDGADNREDEILDAEITKLLKSFERQNLFWREDDYIISPYLQTKEEYMELLERQRGKEYFMPGEDTIEAYALGKVLEKKTPEYKAVHKCLTRELGDLKMAEEMLEEIAGYIVRDDWSIPQVMECLYRWDVTFGKRKTVVRLTEALSKWIYSIRRWSECGYSRKELKKENEEIKYIYKAEKPEKKIAAAKIYPNDPCPCGSGKKYKKCCGR